MDHREIAFAQDCEIILINEEDDEAWEMDDYQVKPIYNGPMCLEKRNPEGKYLKGKMWKGRMRMPYAPPRFQAPTREAEEDESMETDPEEPSVDYTPAIPLADDG